MIFQSNQNFTMPRAEIYYDVCKHAIKSAIIKKSQNTSITFEYTIHTVVTCIHQPLRYHMHYLVIYVLYHFDISGISSPQSVYSFVGYMAFTRETTHSSIIQPFQCTCTKIQLYRGYVYMGHNLAKFQICSKFSVLCEGIVPANR